MSDISLHFTWLDMIVLAPFFGWPGLIIGGLLGALLWRKRRILGGVIGAVIGCVAFAFIRVFML